MDHAGGSTIRKMTSEVRDFLDGEAGPSRRNLIKTKLLKQSSVEEREGILKDKSGEIKITVWNKTLVDSIPDKVWYHVTDLIPRQYYGLQLSTTRYSCFEKSLETDYLECDDQKIKTEKSLMNICFVALSFHLELSSQPCIVVEKIAMQKSKWSQIKFSPSAMLVSENNLFQSV